MVGEGMSGRASLITYSSGKDIDPGKLPNRDCNLEGQPERDPLRDWVGSLGGIS